MLTIETQAKTTSPSSRHRPSTPAMSNLRSKTFSLVPTPPQHSANLLLTPYNRDLPHRIQQGPRRRRAGAQPQGLHPQRLGNSQQGEDGQGLLLNTTVWTDTWRHDNRLPGMNRGFLSSIGDILGEMGYGARLDHHFLGGKGGKGGPLPAISLVLRSFIAHYGNCWDAGMTCAYGFQTLLTHG